MKYAVCDYSAMLKSSILKIMAYNYFFLKASKVCKILGLGGLSFPSV